MLSVERQSHTDEIPKRSKKKWTTRIGLIAAAQVLFIFPPSIASAIVSDLQKNHQQIMHISPLDLPHDSQQRSPLPRRSQIPDSPRRVPGGRLT